MEIELVDNLSRNLLEALQPAIEESEECKVAIAYVSSGGFSLLQSAIRKCVAKGGYVEFLVGLDLSATDVQALWSLYQLSQAEQNVACYCLTELGPSVVYHPKLYVIKVGDAVTISIGSSNLTEGGLKRNVEVNALIKAKADEELVSEIYAVYNSLKFHPKRIKPDEEFLSLYEEIYSARRKQERFAERDADFRQLRSTFQEKVASLRRPVPTPRDLFGWQKLVFEKLPHGQFRTSDIYPFEEEFRSHYPENRYIRAKIRQILQQLRDIGMIRHVGRETWVMEANAYETSVR